MPNRKTAKTKGKLLAWADWFRSFEGSVARLHPGTCENTVQGRECQCGYRSEKRQAEAKQLYKRKSSPAQAAHHHERGCRLTSRRARCTNHTALDFVFDGICANCGHSLVCCEASERDYRTNRAAREAS